MTCESIGIKPLGLAETLECIVKAKSQNFLFGAGANRESEISDADATLPLNGEVWSDLEGLFNTTTRETQNDGLVQEPVAGQDQVLIFELGDLCVQNLVPNQLSPAAVDFLLQVIEPLPKIEQVSEWLSTSCMPLYFSAKHKWSRATAWRESSKVDSKLPESILKSRPGNKTNTRATSSDFKLRSPRLGMKDKLKKNVQEVAVRVFDSLTGRKITRYTLRGEELPRKSRNTKALDVSASSGSSRDGDSGSKSSAMKLAKSMSSLSSMMRPSIPSLADTRTGKDAGSHACSSSGGPEACEILSDPEPWPSREERMLRHQKHMFSRKSHMSAFDLASEEDLEQAVTFRFYDSVEIC